MPFQRKLWHQKIANKNIKIFLISQLLRSNTYLLKYFACYCDQILCPKVFLQARHEGLRPDRYFRLCACKHFEQRIYRARAHTSVDDKVKCGYKSNDPPAGRSFSRLLQHEASRGISTPPGWDACQSQSTCSKSIAGCRCLYVQDPFQIIHTVSSVM